MRWSNARNANINTPAIDLFIADVLAVCKKHGLCIAHEDAHGAFLIEKLDQRTLDWLAVAIDCTEEPLAEEAEAAPDEGFTGLVFYVGSGNPGQPGYTTHRATVLGRSADDQDRWVVSVEGQGQVTYHKDTLRQIAVAQVGIGG